MLDRRAILKAGAAVVAVAAVPVVVRVTTTEVPTVEQLTALWDRMTPAQKLEFMAELEELYPVLVAEARAAAVAKAALRGGVA